MEFIKDIPTFPKPAAPYTPAVRANGFIFVSGQVGLDPATGKLVPGGIVEQAKQVLKNVEAVLKASNSSLENVAMTTIFLADIDDFKTINEIYAQYINIENPPARQCIAVKDLPLGSLIEISVIAVG